MQKSFLISEKIKKYRKCPALLRPIVESCLRRQCCQVLVIENAKLCFKKVKFFANLATLDGDC